MATAPAADQRRLLDIQALDTRARQLTHRRKHLPEAARVADLDGQLADLNASLVTSRTALADLRRQLTKAESDVEQVRNRAKRNQERLDSGAVSARDAQALMGELEMLASRREALEEIALDVMERLEAHEQALHDVESAHRELATVLEQAAAERDVRLGEIDAEAGDIATERGRLTEGLDSALLALYEKVRDQNHGQGVVAFRPGGRIEGMNVEISRAELAAIQAAAPDQVVRLEETGHIVVRLG